MPTSAGASDVFTWQAWAGVGSAFEWGAVLFDCRYRSCSQSGEKLIDGLSFGGFGLGVHFRF